MCKTKYIFLLFIIWASTGCNQLDISPDQANAFIKFYGSSGSDVGNDIKQFEEGYIILATVTSDIGNKDIVLIHVDNNGNQINNDTLSSIREGNNYASELLLTQDGGFIVLGTVTDTLNNNTDIYIEKFKPDGTSDWEKIIGTDDNEEGRSIKNANSGYIIAGSTDAQDAGNGNSEGTKDIFLVKLDDTGNTEVTENHGGAGEDFANQVIVISTGYLLVGTSNSFNEPGQDRDNIIVVQTNQYGGSPDYITYGAGNNDYGTSLLTAEGGGYLIIGTVENSVGDNSNIRAIRVEDDIHNIIWNEEYEANVALGNKVIKYNHSSTNPKDFNSLLIP